MLRVLQESEGVVQPGSPLLELGDPSLLDIVVDVLTSDAVHDQARCAACRSSAGAAIGRCEATCAW